MVGAWMLRLVSNDFATEQVHHNYCDFTTTLVSSPQTVLVSAPQLVY